MRKTFRTMLVVAMLSSVATFAYAEDPAAPVYDADSMGSQSTDAPPAADNSGSGDQQSVSQDDASAAPATPSRADVRDLPNAVSPAAVQTDQPLPHTLTLDQRLHKVEQQIDNMQSSGSSNKVDELQNEMQTLRGQVDDLTHQLQQLQQKQSALQTSNDSLEKRVKETKSDVSSDATKSADATTATRTPKEPKKSVVDSTSATPAETDADKQNTKSTGSDDSNSQSVSDEQQTYQTAYDLIKAKKYNDAIAALQKMLVKYPSGQSAANAHYWLGELYGLTGKNDQSASEFSTIIKNFPSSPKVADAQLKLGLIYATEMKWPSAKTAFKRVISSYPGSASARLAQEQLKQIKQAGH